MGLIRLVQWDLDGTLIDTRDALCRIDIEVVHEFTGKRYSFDEYMKKFDPTAHWLEHYESFGIKGKQRQQQALDRFSFLEEIMETVVLINGASEVLSYLHSKKIPQHLTTRHENIRVVENKLRRSGLEEYFGRENITITDGNKTEKIIRVCQQYNVAPENTAFVTDTANDVRSGNNAGVITFAVYHPESYSSLEKLKQANPAAMFFDLHILRGFFKAHYAMNIDL